jgi:signal transduction histidine kinase
MRRYPLFHRFYLILVATMVLFAISGVTMRHTLAEPLPLPVWALVFVVLAMILSLGTYPFVRRLTNRLSRLQQTVGAFGRGELDVRASVEGHDEVSQLAQGFNLAAERIEALVAAHKRLLANASYELRTPLTRIRLGVELLTESADSSRKSELERDLRELDDLLEEILLASRLEALPKLDGADEELDLLALIAEECARYDQIEFDYPHSDSGTHAMWLQGNERLLRRLVRNLLENARRHGAPPTSLRLSADEEGVALRVTDAGPGVAEADRERVFEPFFRGGNAEENVGSGLGLSLVRQIARRHGGDAVCHARLDGRSEFIANLPKRSADERLNPQD